MEDIAKYVERLIVMNNGSIVLDGKPAEIFQFEKNLRNRAWSATGGKSYTPVKRCRGIN